MSSECAEWGITSQICGRISPRSWVWITAHRVGIIGAGRLGTALANYQGIEKSNFTVVALFDNDVAKIGMRIGSANALVHDVKRISSRGEGRRN